MSKTNAFETDYNELIFQNTNVANIGDAGGLRGDIIAGNLYVALYVISPSEGSSGVECTYGSYARVSVARSGAGWTISGNNATNTSPISFPQCTSGSESAVAVAILSEVSSSTVIMYYGALDASLSISAGVTPAFIAGALDINES